MSIWSLLGIGTNWDRVEKKQEKEYLEQITMRIADIINLDIFYDNNIEKMLQEACKKYNLDEEAYAEEIYKIIKGFGPKVPTTTEYYKLGQVGIERIPSARKVKKFPSYQTCWDKGWQWAKEYRKTRSAFILFEKDKKIKELELEIKKMDKKIKELEIKNSLIKN